MSPPPASSLLSLVVLRSLLIMAEEVTSPWKDDMPPKAKSAYTYFTSSYMESKRREGGKATMGESAEAWSHASADEKKVPHPSRADRPQTCHLLYFYHFLTYISALRPWQLKIGCAIRGSWLVLLRRSSSLGSSLPHLDQYADEYAKTPAKRPRKTAATPAKEAKVETPKKEKKEEKHHHHKVRLSLILSLYLSHSRAAGGEGEETQA